MSKIIVTANGRVLTAVHGGGFKEPNAAFHTDAGEVGPWETFTLENVDDKFVALRTYNGNYVTAVRGGGLPVENYEPDYFDPGGMHTDRRWSSGVGPWELFNIQDQGDGTVSIQTSSGQYLTAMNGGGWGEPANRYPLHTDATVIGPWEMFRIEDPPPPRPPMPPPSGSWFEFGITSKFDRRTEEPNGTVIYWYVLSNQWSIADGIADMVTVSLMGAGNHQPTLSIGGISRALDSGNSELSVDFSGAYTDSIDVSTVNGGLYYSFGLPWSGTLRIRVK